MTEVIKTAQGRQDEHEAHSILAGFYLRKGEYAESLAETERILAVSPDDADAQGNIAFLRAAARFPDQRIVSAGTAHLSWTYPGKSLTIPLTINGKRANYFIDTGANVSTMSDADAQRLGLELQEASASVNGASGASAPFRVANAKQLRIGNFELQNVVFLVSSANQPPFNDKPVLEQGIIGLPILLAAKHIRWNRSGFDIVADTTAAAASPAPNLLMDEGYVIANATFQHDSLSFLLDSGSIWTFMYPRFAQNHVSYVKAHGSMTSKQLQGFGGQIKVPAWHLPKLRVRIAETVDDLNDVDVLLDHTDQNSYRYDGCLGLDTMLHRGMVDLNFEQMQIVIR